jgi:hypothetical protein
MTVSRLHLVFLVLLFAGMAFVGPRWHYERPAVWQGDEPHYLVMLNSLLQDGDLDLGNNYLSARRGGQDAGRYARGRPLDHHTVWWHDGRRVEWGDQHTPGKDEADPQGVVERPAHPPGLAWFLAALLWPWRATPAVEELALLCITLSGVVALLLFHALVRGWARSEAAALAVTAAAFLGTPVWHYSRKLFAEEPLVLCAIGAAYFTLRRPNGWAAGAFLAAGTLMKPPFLLLALPPGALFAVRREWKCLTGLCLMCLGGVAATLVSNASLYGSSWRSPQAFQFGNPLEAAWGLSVGWERGSLEYAPVLLAAVVGWPTVRRQHPIEAAVVLAAIGLYVGLICLWHTWSGGWCYGPQLLVPIFPLAMVGLLGLAQAPRSLRGAAIALGVVSVTINVVAAGGWAYVPNVNPWSEMVRELRPRHS